MTILSSRKANSNGNQGGGDKKQGGAVVANNSNLTNLAIKQSGVFNASNRNVKFCINQLGGIGRGKSQFGVTADGTHCDEEDKTLQFIADINSHIQEQISKHLGTFDSGSNEQKYNQVNRFELCLVGEIESFLNDLSNANQALSTLVEDVSHVVFSHFESPPSSNHSLQQIVFVDSSNGTSFSNKLNISFSPTIAKKIKYINNKLPILRPDLFTHAVKNQFGIHTLGLLNNNFQFKNTGLPWNTDDAPKQHLLTTGYGLPTGMPLFYGLHVYAKSSYTLSITLPPDVPSKTIGFASSTVSFSHFSVKQLIQFYEITHVTFSPTSTLTTIDTNAFAEFFALTSVTFSTPSKVTTIGVFAFDACRSLTSIIIPISVITIGSYAFAQCTGLTSVTFSTPSKVTSISDSMFKSCSALTSIYIPNTVNTIGVDVFHDCPNLTTIDGSGNVSLTPNTITIQTSSQLTSITIPDSVTTIGDYAFFSASLTSITIPDLVTTIGDYAFQTTNLSSINIPTSVTTIGQYAFEESALTSVTFNYITSWPTTVKPTAFEGCTSLSTVNYPYLMSTEAVTAMKTYFQTNLLDQTITYVPKYGPGFIYTTHASSTPIFVSTDTIIREPNVPSNIHTCEITAEVTSIDTDAFSGVSHLSSVTFSPQSQLIYIRSRAFESSSLTYINLPESVTTIDANAFESCMNLTHINIPASVTTIGKYAFLFSRNLTSVKFNYITSWPSGIDSHAFTGAAMSMSTVYYPSSMASHPTAYTAMTSYFTDNYYLKTNSIHSF